MNIIFYDKNGKWFSTVQIYSDIPDITKAKQAKAEINAHLERFGRVDYKIMSGEYNTTKYYNDLMKKLP